MMEAGLFDAEMRDRFMKALRDGEQLDCPCCGRFAQQYKRTIHKGIARTLIALYRLGGDFSHEGNHFHITEFCSIESGMDMPIARFWGLVEAAENQDDRKRTSGYWRLTQRGVNFVKCRIAIPKYVVLYDNEKIDEGGEAVLITHCLTDQFNYTELMEGK